MEDQSTPSAPTASCLVLRPTDLRGRFTSTDGARYVVMSESFWESIADRLMDFLVERGSYGSIRDVEDELASDPGTP